MAKKDYQSKIAAQTQSFLTGEQAKRVEEGKNSVQMPTPSIPEPETEREDISLKADVQDLMQETRTMKKKRKKSTRSFYVNDEYYEKIKLLAERNGINTSDVVNTIFEKYL